MKNWAATDVPLITAAPLAFSDRVNLLNDLFNAGAPVDPFIEGGHGYVDPFTAMLVYAPYVIRTCGRLFERMAGSQLPG